MALTNAERQRRYRDRAREALRNYRHQSPGAQVHIPAILLRHVLPSDADAEDVLNVSEAIAEHIHRFLCSSGIDRRDLDDPALAELLRVFGGEDYVAAVFDWHDARDRYDRSRSKNKGPEPTAPAIPGLPQNSSLVAP